MVATTNLKTIRDDFKAQIKAISPREQKHRASRWRYLQDPEDVRSGAGLRAFSISFGSAANEEAGLASFNDGQSALVAMRVWVSYGGLSPVDDETLMEQDAEDLFFTLEGRIGTGGLDGLLGVLDSGGGASPPEFVVDDDDDGLVGWYDFLIRYYRRDS